MTGSLTAIARRFAFVRETQGPNVGFWVSKFQRETDNTDGQSWCASFVSFILDVAYKGDSPLKRSGSTQVMLADAKNKHFVTKDPFVDCLFFYVNAVGVPHHIGIVTGINPLIGIAGNTSEDGKSSNGTGVFEHVISESNIVFVRLPND